MRKKILAFFLIGFFSLAFLIPRGLKAYTINLEDLFQSTTLEEIIERLVGLIFTVSIVLVPLMIVLAAYLFMTAGGNPQQVAQAKKLITWTLIGFLIVLLSQGIIVMMKQLLGL